MSHITWKKVVLLSWITHYYCGNLVDQLFHYLSKYLMSCFLSRRQVQDEAGSLPRKMINYHLVLATRALWMQGCQELRGVTRDEEDMTSDYNCGGVCFFCPHYLCGILRVSVSFVTCRMKCCFKTTVHHLKNIILQLLRSNTKSELREHSSVTGK